MVRCVLTFLGVTIPSTCIVLYIKHLDTAASCLGGSVRNRPLLLTCVCIVSTCRTICAHILQYLLKRIVKTIQGKTAVGDGRWTMLTLIFFSLTAKLITTVTIDCIVKYGVSQEKMSIFWEITVSVILGIKLYMYVCAIANGFRDRVISLYCCKTVGKQIYYVLFLISVYIVQVTDLVQITQYSTF
jgi:type IV secretory pathway VirB2 component (pilin)